MPCHKKRKAKHGKRRKVLRINTKTKKGRYYKTSGGHLRKLGGLKSKKKPPYRKR